VIQDFDFDGTFRVQSRRLGQRGRIAGNWNASESRLSSDALNKALSNNPLWSGDPINLRAATVTRREGVFRQVPDNLYKIECYEPLNGGAPFPSHIVDVQKAVEQWHQRLTLVSCLFVGNQAVALTALVGDLEATVTNEYCCHEAGHVIGRSVQNKAERFYFAPKGKVLWPLVWVEEFRADLHSYSLGLDVMAPEDAVSLFIYNCFARWAGDALSLNDQSHGYGTIPFLLFALLLEVGFLEIITRKSGTKLAVMTTAISEIARVMTECHNHALREITQHELTTDDCLLWGINAAHYYRQRVLENPLHESYIKLLRHATS
jgi:hypothetical protein